MPDFVINLRLSIDDTSKNKEIISQWAKRFDQESKRSKLIMNILNAAQIPFDSYAVPQISHSFDNEYLRKFRHPELGRSGNGY